MRYAVLVLVGVVVVPLALAGGGVAATAIVGEWVNLQIFDFSDISLLDWLAGGPGAGAGSFENYVTFMVGGVVAIGGFTVMAALWRWASGPRQESDPFLEHILNMSDEEREFIRQENDRRRRDQGGT